MGGPFLLTARGMKLVVAETLFHLFAQTLFRLVDERCSSCTRESWTILAYSKRKELSCLRDSFPFIVHKHSSAWWMSVARIVHLNYAVTVASKKDCVDSMTRRVSIYAAA